MADAATYRLADFGAIGTMLGVVLSGPVSVVIVESTKPQPAWSDATLFAESYDPVQRLPYVGGIVLVVGLVVLMSCLHVVARESSKARSTAAIVFTSVFATSILFNYVVQTTFVPTLAMSPSGGEEALLAALTMANPTSLAWAVEMWGWGAFGAATWLVAPVFEGNRIERAAHWTFVANGWFGVAGASMTTFRAGWVLTPVGIGAFVSWNVLVFAMAALAWAALRRRACAADA